MKGPLSYKRRFAKALLRRSNVRELPSPSPEQGSPNGNAAHRERIKATGATRRSTMKSALVFVSALFQGQAIAACAAMPQVTECVNANLKTRLAACTDVDYQCKCDAYDYVKACFLNCPNDPTAQGQAREYDGLKQNYCASASLSKPVNSTPVANTTDSPSSSASDPKSSGKPSASPSATGSGAFDAKTPSAFLLVLSLVSLSH